MRRLNGRLLAVATERVCLARAPTPSMIRSPSASAHRRFQPFTGAVPVFVTMIWLPNSPRQVASSRYVTRQVGGAMGGTAFAMSSAAISLNHLPAGGSTIPRAGSIGPAVPRRQLPSDSPGTLPQSLASMSSLPVAVVGRSPSPRPGGLHQTSGSAYWPAGGDQGPWPLRLVSMTKCASESVVGGLAALSTLSAYHWSVSPQVLKSLGLAG